MSDFGGFPAVSRIAQDDQGLPANYTTVLANATFNLKGAWVESAASCPFDAQALSLNMICSTGFRSALVDIGVGGAGSEIVVVPNIMISQNNSYASHATAIIPFQIPSGSRVSMRLQCSVASGDFYPKMHFIAANGGLPMQNATAYGADVATSYGTQVFGPASTNTKGSWYQIDPATASDMAWALICIGWPSNASPPLGEIALDIGIGAAAAEVVVVPDLYCDIGSPSGTIQPAWISLPLSIPAGTRIAARLAGSIANLVASVSIVGFK